MFRRGDVYYVMLRCEVLLHPRAPPRSRVCSVAQAQPQPLKASQTDSFTPSTAESRSGRGVSKMTIVELVLGAIILKVLPGCTEMSKTLPVQSVKNWEEAVFVNVSNLHPKQQGIFADSFFETLKCKGTGGRSSNLTLEGVEQPIKTGESFNQLAIF